MSNYTPPQHTPGQGMSGQGSPGQGTPAPGAPVSGVPGPGPAKAPRSTANRAILIATSVVGGLALIGTATSAAFGTWVADYSWQGPVSVDETYQYVEGDSVAELYADAEGVTAIDIDIAAGDFTIKYDDVSEAILSMENAIQTDPDVANGWTLERSDDELIVNREHSRRAGDLCLFGCGPGAGEETVTLTLPRELGENRAASLDVQVAAGRFTGAGSFDEVNVEVNAGTLSLTGDARTLDLDVNVGEATVNLADVEEATAAVTTGSTSVKLTGTAPSTVALSAEMGSITAQLPAESYRVDVKAELGSIDNRLEVDKNSKHVVQVRAEAAEIVLKH